MLSWSLTLHLVVLTTLHLLPSARGSTSTSAGLQCYICDSTSYASFSDAEAQCNRRSLRRCPHAEHSACMIEAYKRNGPVYRVVKQCRSDCPVSLNSTAQHIRCCFKDACNDFITIETPAVAEGNDVKLQGEGVAPGNEIPHPSGPSVHSTTTTTGAVLDHASSPTSSPRHVNADHDRDEILSGEREEDDDAMKPETTSTTGLESTENSSSPPPRRRSRPPQRRPGLFPFLVRERYGRRPFRSSGISTLRARTDTVQLLCALSTLTAARLLRTASLLFT